MLVLKLWIEVCLIYLWCVIFKIIFLLGIIIFLLILIFLIFVLIKDSCLDLNFFLILFNFFFMIFNNVLWLLRIWCNCLINVLSFLCLFLSVIMLVFVKWYNCNIIIVLVCFFVNLNILIRFFLVLCLFLELWINLIILFKIDNVLIKFLMICICFFVLFNLNFVLFVIILIWWFK